jgi:hypothetical protein
MAAARTAFREKLQADLAAALGIEFVGGPVAGPVEDRNVGCVWWETKRPWGGDFNVEEDTFRVRVFRLWKQDQGMTTQGNVVPLEEDAEKLEAALIAIVGALGQGFFNVVQVSPDYDRQYVEAVLTAYDWNRSAAGG